MPSHKMEAPERYSEETVPPAMAFTVTFDSAKTTSNKFIRRHIRNLSLPIAKVYDNKCSPQSPSESTMNGNPFKKQGNHSEGYYSSDPEEEGTSSMNSRNGVTVEDEPINPQMEEEEEAETGGSDVASETGTYTIEKEKPEIITARVSIDANFGLQPETSSHAALRESKQWINEWATQVVNHNKALSPSTEVISKSTVIKSTHVTGVSKIPSPLATRARFGIKGGKSSSGKDVTVRPQLNPRSAPAAKEECSDSSLETECFLKTTETVMSAIAARMSVSIDANEDGRLSKSALHHSDSSASESSSFAVNNTSSTRYNRAFSLRRGRLDEGGTNGTRAAEKSTVPGCPSAAPRQPRKVQPVAPVTPSQTRTKSVTNTAPLSRTDTGRFSMRAKQPPQTPTTSNGVLVKKKSTGGGRSNSTLTPKEVEFQNWKRRKSYDPMKAAAEGKMKEAAKKQTTNVMTQSTTNATCTPKSPVNSVLRSASFHGTRQLNAPSSSEEEEEEVATVSDVEDDYPLPQAPKTSLENTPRGSRVSLYSNSNTSPVRSWHKIEGVDNLVVSAIYGISNKLKGSTCSILRKLRYLYDEESEKNKRLLNEIDKLESGEASSPHKLPSKELSAALRNLKGLDATLKALDEVLFDQGGDFE